MKKNFEITKPRSTEQIMPVPLLCRGFTVLTEDTVFMSPTRDGTATSTSLEQRKANAVPSLLSCFNY